MILQAYSLYDGKAKTFQQPFFLQNDDVAKRSFYELVNDEKTVVNRHPGDFCLYNIGSYDDEKGSMHKITPMDLVATALQLKRVETIDLSKMIKLEKNSKEEPAEVK